ncbi:putative dynein ATPase [Helianthus anomalus]
MLEGKAVIGETDMLQTMQDNALQLAAKTLDFLDVNEATDIARVIKQCIVGTDFGSFVTHYYGSFIHFSIGSRAILLFRGSAG